MAIEYFTCDFCEATVFSGERLYINKGGEDHDDGFAGGWRDGAGECEECGKACCPDCWDGYVCYSCYAEVYEGVEG